MQEHYSAIILAGGKSSRMGRAKQLLKVDGTSMLDHAILAALDAGITTPIVVLGGYASQIEAHSNLLARCTVVLNKNYRMGLSTSLKSGLQSAPSKSTAYIFMLADQPLVDGKLVLAMMNEFEKTTADILYPTYQGKRGNPVIITAQLREQINLAKGDNGAKFLFAAPSLSVVAYPVANRAVITDVDTPADYQNLSEYQLVKKSR